MFRLLCTDSESDWQSNKNAVLCALHTYEVFEKNKKDPSGSVKYMYFVPKSRTPTIQDAASSVLDADVANAATEVLLAGFLQRAVGHNSI